MYRKLCLIIKKKTSEEKGAVLILALVMLAISLVMIIPLLDLMESSHKSTHQVYNQKAYELYAADAGVRVAMLRIQNQEDLPTFIGDNKTYPEDDFTLNNKNVSYTLTSIDPIPFGGGAVYRIISTAGNTTITADAVLVDFTKLFLENIVTSSTDADIKNNVSVGGTLQIPNPDVVSGGSSAEPVNGFISSVIIRDRGDNYTAPRIFVTDPGGLSGGSGAAATPLFEGGKINKAIMNSGGSDYTGPIVVFSDDNGKNAAATAVVKDNVLLPDNSTKNGVIVDIILTDGGYGYSEDSLSVDIVCKDGTGTTVGSGAKIDTNLIEVVNGEITLIPFSDNITEIAGITHVEYLGTSSGGSGYTSPIVSFDDLGNRPAIVEAIIGAPGSSDSGKLLGFNVVDGGLGYIDPATITVDISPPPKGGTRARAHVTSIYGGRLTNASFVIDAPGSNYKSSKPPDVAISNAPEGVGSGATGVATVKNTGPGPLPSDLISTIWPSGGSGSNPLESFYLKQVEANPGIQVIESNSVNLTTIVGPAYIDGGGGTVTFTTNGSACTLPDTTENRLIFVNGSVVFNNSNLYLNSYTLFASSTDYNLAVKISNDSDVTGPGSIIAIGGIDFQPKLVNNQYIYLMSTDGRVRLAPMNDFVGSVAAKELLVQSGDPKKVPAITWADPWQLELNLPDGEVHGLLLVGFASWIIE